MITGYLIAHPTALVDGDSGAPDPVARLIEELIASGVEGLQRPRCLDCGEPKPLVRRPPDPSVLVQHPGAPRLRDQLDRLIDESAALAADTLERGQQLLVGARRATRSRTLRTSTVPVPRAPLGTKLATEHLMGVGCVVVRLAPRERSFRLQHSAVTWRSTRQSARERTSQELPNEGPGLRRTRPARLGQRARSHHRRSDRHRRPYRDVDDLR
jgi:hypothetical protein